MPAPLTSFLNLSALATRPILLTEVLLRASTEIPSLRPAALSANVIAGLETGPSDKARGMFTLLHSDPFRVPLNRHPVDGYPGVFRTLLAPGPSAALPIDEALGQLAGVLWELETPWLRAILSSVVGAGGLGPLALAVERRALGIPERDYWNARRELRRVEKGLKALLQDHESPEHFRLRGTKAFRARMKGVGVEERGGLLFIDTLARYLEKEFPESAYAGQKRPTRWTDYLLRRSGESPADGSCSPAHGLYAHLSLIAGRGVGAVFYPEHVNAYDPQLDLVFDLPDLYFSTLDDWRGSHYLGRDETPAPVYAFLAGLLLNLSEEKEAPFAPAFAAALRLHPISALHVAALVATKNPDLIGLAEAGKLVSENPGHPLSHAVLAYTLSREGRFDESSAALRTALALKRTLGETPHGAVMGLKPMMDIAMRTALIVCTSGRFQEGVELLQEMLASEPENGEILGVLGTLHCMKASQSSEDPSSAGDFEKAAGFLKQALRFVPEEKPVALDVAFNLGIALLGLNRDLDEILPHWRRAVAVSERHRAQLSSVLERLRQSGDPRDGERARRIEEDLRKPD